MRNNILLTFSDFLGKTELGIYKEKKSREVLKINEINFISKGMKELANHILKNLINDKQDNIYNYDSNNGLLNHICIRENESNFYMLEFYIQYLDDTFINYLKEINWKKLNVKSVNYQITKNKNFRNYFEKIFGDYLIYKISNYFFAISAGCFFQTNNEVLKYMYSDIQNNIVKNKNYILLDLYCGVGIISILLSNYFKKTIGIEVNENSINMANYNSKTNNCTNNIFLCGEVENLLDKINYENAVLFINPPRRGLYNNVIDKIKTLKKIKQILYLSCCWKTLIRDLNYFNCEYQIINEYDMFPNTNHKEFLVNLILN